MNRIGWLAGFVLLGAVSPILAQADSAPAEPLRVMTFNIRYNNPNDGPDAWPHRSDWVAEIVRDSGVDVAGFQEVVHEQTQDLQAALTAYGWYGVGRDDGKQRGESVPIFYRRERFELLDKSAFWLSETPEVAGSKSWDAAITRVTTWIKLRDRDTDTVFFVFNTHFDHVGNEARTESARLLRKRIEEIAGNAPAVLLGDFNSKTSTQAYAILTGQDEADGVVLADARTRVQGDAKGPDSTWNGFRRIVPGRRIDFIFVCPAFSVRSHTIDDQQRDGRFPSDHLPVTAELVFNNDRRQSP